LYQTAFPFGGDINAVLKVMGVIGKRHGNMN
jgi:hypothetical protein